MKNKPENHLQNFGQGAVYFGWLGIVLGLIAITGTPSFIWGDVRKDWSRFSPDYADCFIWLHIEAGNNCTHKIDFVLNNRPKHDTRTFD